MKPYDDESPRYFAQHWRNIPQEKLDTLEEFMAWYQWEKLHNIYADEDEQVEIDAKIKAMQELVNEFLEYKPDKVEEYELELLNKWIEVHHED